jgi:hypothetical protein
MYKRSLFSLAIVVAVLAILFASRSPKPAVRPLSTPWPGRNSTVLFLSNSENGLANVLLATSHALLQEHSDLELHFASFPKLAPSIDKLNKFGGDAAARGTSDGSVPQITFHPLTGKSLIMSLQARGVFVDSGLHPPGLAGLNDFLRLMQDCMLPWSGPDYISLYQEILRLIEDIDPLVVVVDLLFGPGLDATSAMGRNRVIISPNTLKDTFVADQPWGAFFWKYPVYVLLFFLCDFCTVLLFHRNHALFPDGMFC